MSPKQQEKKFSPEYSHELLRIAEGDLSAAVAIGKDPNARIENAFFMVQQAIEKALKAVLVYREISIPLVHDLGALLAKLPAEQDCPYGYELNELNQYATIRRYEEGHYKLTSDELDSVMKITQEMLAWAKNTLQNK